MSNQENETITYPSRIAGTSYPNPDGSSRDKYIRKYVRPGLQLILKREPENKFDKNAVAIFVPSPSGPLQIGYLTSRAIEDASPALDANKLVTAVVTEVTGGQGDKSNVGVNIQITISDQMVATPELTNESKSPQKKKGILGFLGLKQ